MDNRQIILKKVCVHNLKSVDLKLNPNELTVFTGVSGSGKSSLAFDTLYIEGQRRYIESLSTFARHTLGEFPKPDVESVEGITPTISIEQKTSGKNPRSTVGTMTEVYDYLRILYSRVGIARCPLSGEEMRNLSQEELVSRIATQFKGKKLQVLAPYARQKKGTFKDDFTELLRKGLMRMRVDGQFLSLDEEVPLDKNSAHDVDIVVDRLVLNDKDISRLTESILLALEYGEGRCIIYTDEDHLFSTSAYSVASGMSYETLEPQDFSFNSPRGMCPVCQGLGEEHQFNLEQVIDPNKSIAEDCCVVASLYNTVRYKNIYDNLAELYNFDIKTPWKDLSKSAQDVFLKGTKKKWTRMCFVHPHKESTWTEYVHWRGVLHEAYQRYAEAKSTSYKKRMEALMTLQVCSACNGNRLKAYPSATTFHGKHLYELTRLPINECLAFFENISLLSQEKILATDLIKEIKQRLRFLVDVGLDYLSLDRNAPSLSGGESQRVRLASQVGCGLVGVTYILDEPSIGLHTRDNQKLIETLKELRDRGNSVIVVEHDEETILSADRIVDFGPGAGEQGGEILYNGTVSGLLKNKKSITGQFLSGRICIPIPKKLRSPKKEHILLKGASHNNLKSLDVKFPLGCFIAISGVSGSGKSSLIQETLFPALCNALHNASLPTGKYTSLEGLSYIDKVIAIDQSPIGKNPRSNPSTYVKVFDLIRDLFTQLPESKARGYKPGRFSFNVKDGTCSQCHGMGMCKVDMDFMEDAWALCTLCEGKRFDRGTLDIHFKEKNIYDVLEMTVREALEFFAAIPAISQKLQTLSAVGMDYIHLGQASTTLSGGEAQRIKLAKELTRPSTGKTLYILDEPTTGLHFADIKKLLEILHSLVNLGNTVIVIEHNLEVIKTADWVLDLGPEGGSGGGQLVAEGTPAKIAKLDTPTGTALKPIFENVPKVIPKKCTSPKQGPTDILVKGASMHNLKHIDIAIPRNKITVCTGPSGSGKTSFAFDTLYAEGQRRYVDSLSPYARQFVKQMPKPKVLSIEGLSPAIAIEQKSHAGNPRSTVGTMTEVYDYLRILYARLGIAYCPETGEEIKAISKEHVVDRLLALQDEKLQILSPLEIRRQDDFKEVLKRFQRLGYLRIRLNEIFYELGEEIPYDKRRKNTLEVLIDRIKVSSNIKARLYEAVENAASFSKGKIVVLRENGETLFYNLSFAVESTGKAYPEITPHSFGFNTKEGMCMECNGLGVLYGANLSQHPILSTLTLAHILSVMAPKIPKEFLKVLKIPFDIPLCELNDQERTILLHGSTEEYSLKNGLHFQWRGLDKVFAKLSKAAAPILRQTILPLLEEYECPSCQGSRLNPLSRNVRLQGKPLGDFCKLPIRESLQFITSLDIEKQDQKLLEEVLRQVHCRLQFLNDVGLGYLGLDRRAPTLSGGEAQRIRLAKQLGSQLTGVLYVLDEPTIGLHPYDNERLNKTLKKLCDLGNTLLLVEHDPLTVATADYLLDFGPQGGNDGGYVVAKGNLGAIMKDKNSLTGNYLSGKRKIPVPKTYRSLDRGSLTIRNARKNNLKGVDVNIPLNTFSCLSGVSGSGKSTLLHAILKPAVERGLQQDLDSVSIGDSIVTGIDAIQAVAAVDQNPVGQSSRSDLSTYSDVLTPLRFFFASLPQACTKGLKPKNFSHNHRKGMCTHCWGHGYRKVEMHFLPPVHVTCEYCQGYRLNPQSLEVLYQGKHLGQYLQMTVDELCTIFVAHPKILKILTHLGRVGLGYLCLNQQMATLSGGEAQRLKLSRELGKRRKKNTLYLLDEPTTGLHYKDVEMLLSLLHELVDQGNTVVCIEHHTDVLKNADFIIDLGPGAGDDGGHLVAQGRPEEIRKTLASVTGKFLL